MAGAEIKWTKSQSDAINARGCSLAVSAAAGSGKTAVLTQRIIEELKSGADISRMIIVTFTNDAVRDLRNKIRNALSEALSSAPSSSHMRRQLLKLSGAKISTISGFCMSLVRANFRLCGVPSDFSLLSETQDEILRKNIAEELINDFYCGNVESFYGKIENFAYFAETFGRTEDTDSLSSAISCIYGKLSSRVDFIDSVKYFADAVSENAGNFSDTVYGRYIYSYILEFTRHYKPIFSSFYIYSAENEKNSKYSENIAKYIDFIVQTENAVLENAPFETLKNIFISCDFTGRAASSFKTPEAKYYKAARDAFKDDVEEIVKMFFSFGDNAPRDGAELISSSLYDLYVFLKAYKSRLDAEKRRRHVLTFDDVERTALSLMVDLETKEPTSLAISMRDDFDEIYIDEYQDTNEVQDMIFSALSKGDNRFVVGDIKQSIYSFRGAVTSLFGRLIERSENYGENSRSSEQRIFLSQNFRSTDEILGFANTVFETLMERGKIMAYGKDERLFGSGKHGDKVHIAVCVEEKGSERDAESEYVAHKIKDMLSNGEKKLDGSAIRPSDIVIMLRAMTHAGKYRSALGALGVPCEEIQTERLFETPEVMLMVSLLSVIDNPERDIHLAATLKSPLYGVTLDELLYIRRYDKSGSLFSALSKFTEEKNFKKGKRFLSDYEKYREKARTSSCDELIWQIYLEKEMLSLVAVKEEPDNSNDRREAARSNLIQFYNYAREFSGSSFRGLYDFITFISDVIENGTKIKLSASSGSTDTVKIITVHSSKGLEFPVCFLCRCGATFNNKDAEKDTVIDSDFGIIPLFPSPDGLKRLNTLQRAAAIMKMKKNVPVEELRILYVALTRARERLYITGTIKESKEHDAEYYKEYYNIFSGNEKSFYGMAGKFFSPFAVLNYKNYLDMILTAVAEKDIACDIETVLCEETETASRSESTVFDEPVFCENDEADEGITLVEARRLVKERFSFSYGHESLSSVPSKLSVSKLYHDVLDGNDGALDISSENAEDDSVTVKVPKFLMSETENADGARRGSATHLFMQFFDFRSVEKLGVDGEIARLESEKFIFPADASLIDKKSVLSFLSSALAEEMKKSERIYREKRFIINYPAEEFTSDEKTKLALTGERLLVQGIIDCAFFNSKGELILVDYKTDHFSRGTSVAEAEKILRDRHSRQIGYYKYACAEMFGKKCAHAYIYSFSLNKTIEI